MWHLTMVLLMGSFQLTSYRSVPSQTDSTPFITSTGERVHKHGIAVSRDLLCPMALSRDMRIRRHRKETCKLQGLHYAQWLYVPGYGLREVNDTMNKRHRRAMDLWVATKEEESKVGVRRTRVFKVEGI